MSRICIHDAFEFDSTPWGFVQRANGEVIIRVGMNDNGMRSTLQDIFDKALFTFDVGRGWKRIENSQQCNNFRS